MAGERLSISGGIIDNQPDGFKSTVSLLNVFRDDSYTRLLGIFIILSVVSAFFIQYSFLAVTRERFPAGEDIARFLGIFTGCIMILTLAGQVAAVLISVKRITDLKSALPYLLYFLQFLRQLQSDLAWEWVILWRQPGDL